jgi:hypothetical protein
MRKNISWSMRGAGQHLQVLMAGEANTYSPCGPTMTIRTKIDSRLAVHTFLRMDSRFHCYIVESGLMAKAELHE